MADFGAIGIHRGAGRATLYLPIYPLIFKGAGSAQPSRKEATWAFDSEHPYVTTPTISELRGTVKQGAAVIPYAEVALYWRHTRAFVGRTRCNAAGAFAFTDLTADVGGYFAVAFDPDGAPNQNALIFDKLTALP